MSGVLSKRQQARNEKVLQDLVQNTLGNNLCADCGARNPGWASWSLGIFLCMRCATIHRKLGTHISKVKSLSMDSWSNEQVENMKKVGNISSNKTYNPENRRAPVAVDLDEVDTAMERYIRSKYMQNGLAKTRRQDTGDSESDVPPPLPPKTGSRFGFRSASSIFPLGSKAKKETAREVPASPRDHTLHRNKPSQVFGASVGYDVGATRDDTESKLGKLKDMGFADSQRNAAVLRGVNGNLERAIETLVRLGGAEGQSSASLVSPRESSLSTNRSLAPAESMSLGSTRPTSATSASNNPFDMLDMPPTLPQSSQSTGTLQNRNPYMSSNPFGIPAQQSAVSLDQSFAGLSLAQPQPPQSLFPHHTGGALLQQQPNSQQLMYQQAPAMPSVPQGYSSAIYSNNQPIQQPVPTSYNPFYSKSQPPQQQQQQPLMVNTANGPGGYANNPFARSPTRIQSPTLTQIPEQSQQNFYNSSPQPNLYSVSPNPQQNHYRTSPQPQQPPQFQQSQLQPRAQPLQPQHTNNPFAVQQPQPVRQTQRPDNAAIMALYSLSPVPAVAPTQPRPQLAPPVQQLSAFDQMFGQTAPQQTPQQIATSTSSKNPFLGMNAAPRSEQVLNGGYQHKVSRDSMMALGMEWSNGRHSPDAFASLSARQ